MKEKETIDFISLKEMLLSLNDTEFGFLWSNKSNRFWKDVYRLRGKTQEEKQMLKKGLDSLLIEIPIDIRASALFSIINYHKAETLGELLAAAPYGYILCRARLVGKKAFEQIKSVYQKLGIEYRFHD